MILEFEKYRTDLEALRAKLHDVGDGLHIDHIQQELTELHEEQGEPGFWDNLERSALKYALAMIMPLSTAEEADTLSFYENELYTYMNELFANLIAGNYSLDDYAGYVEQMNDLGLEKVLAIYQGMYDRLQH